MERLKPGWQTFDHVADIGIRGIGRTLEEAFCHGAKALFTLMVEDLAKVEPRTSKGVSCTSFDLSGLFVAWINALISAADVEGMVFCDFKISIQETTAEGRAFGEPWSLERHGRGIEVKGATFTEAEVKRQNGLWIAQCVVDV